MQRASRFDRSNATYQLNAMGYTSKTRPTMADVELVCKQFGKHFSIATRRYLLQSAVGAWRQNERNKEASKQNYKVIEFTLREVCAPIQTYRHDLPFVDGDRRVIQYGADEPIEQVFEGPTKTGGWYDQ